jgi:4-diphosphocytidyl-2-C-methyl-D-erythritol kinase
VATALAFAAQFGRPRLSGSGASVFVDFPSHADAERARGAVPPAFRAFVAKGLNRSPLFEVSSRA